MLNFKKIISIMLCIASVFCIAACGDASTADTTTGTTVTTSTTAATSSTTAATPPPPVAQPDNTQYNKIDGLTRPTGSKTPVDKAEYEDLITALLDNFGLDITIGLILQISMTDATKQLPECDIEALQAREVRGIAGFYTITINPQNVNMDIYRNLTTNENVEKIYFEVETIQFVPT